MTVNVRIAIASHLSDAQEYLELGFIRRAHQQAVARMPAPR